MPYTAPYGFGRMATGLAIEAVPIAPGVDIAVHADVDADPEIET